jgi:hypothetical protein
VRVIAPFFAVLASVATVVSAMVRLWWSKPTPTPPGVQDGPPKAAPWMQTAAKWWLILVLGGGTIIFFIVVIYTIVSLS